MASNKLQFISEVIYDLKRDYGGPVEIYQNVIGAETNFKTGEKTITKNKWSIRRAVRLPKENQKDAIFSIIANRLFQYGNFIRLADRVILVDNKDLPKGLKIGLENWYALIDGIRYNIISVDEYEDRAMVIGLKNLVGQPREAVVEMDVKQNITTTPTIDETL